MASGTDDVAARPTGYERRSDPTVAQELDLLMAAFADVLEDLGEDPVAASLPWLDERRTGAPGRPVAHGALGDSEVRARSMAFRLLNLAEERAAARARSAGDPEALRGTWHQVLGALREAGVAGREVRRALGSVHVEPVLTAHPTESKRTTVLEHYRRLHGLLDRGAEPAEVTVELERIWLTGDVFLHKPEVGHELRHVIRYLRDVFPAAVRGVHEGLERTWSEQGWDAAGADERPAVADERPADVPMPRVTFGTWVGGDRDGHPLVTGDVTRATLATLRTEAMGLIAEHLDRLAANMSLSAHQVAPPQALRGRIEELRTVLGGNGDRVVARNPHEPWRQLPALLLEALPPASPRVSPEDPGCVDAEKLAGDLALMHDSLLEVGAWRLARAEVAPVMRLLDSVGFHLAVVDVRQNSAVHDRALEQVVAAGGVDIEGFSTWSEERRRGFLDAELTTLRPFTTSNSHPGPEAASVLDSHRVLVEHIQAHGPDGLGSLIVSMTRSVSDLLVVHLLAREVGLLVDEGEGPRNLLAVVPLFETIEDLARAPEILAEYLDHPVARRTLRARAPEGEMPVQQVMVGYSDSNKDGGLCASLWSVHVAQRRMTEVAAQRGVRVRFFHGRGGSLGRGAGPTSRFIRALPSESLGGDLRLTEQGETISQKYDHPLGAVHHLELLVAGVSGVEASRHTHGDRPHPLEPLLAGVADRSRQVYTELLGSDGFMDFFRAATPIDVIERTRIGSRPARRTGAATIADLRAIPWVFAWGQARYSLSGWYGLGTALHELREADSGAFEALAQDHVSWTTLHYLVANAATSVATASPSIMAAYAELVSDEAVRDSILGRFLEEHRMALEMLGLLYGGPLAERRPRVQQNLDLRNEALEDLHHHQIALLSEWRECSSDGAGDEADVLLERLLLSVNAIASGLRTTG